MASSLRGFGVFGVDDLLPWRRMASQETSSPLLVCVPPLKNQRRARRREGLDVLVGDGAADGGDVHAELIGDEGHGEGLEELGPVVEVLALGVDDDADDARACVCAARRPR